MKACFFRKHGNLEVLEVGRLPDFTVIPPGHVLVRVHAVGLNHLDVWVRRGLPHLKLSFPHVVAAEGSGVVESVGPEVTTLKKGDAVIVHPGLSCGKCDRCLQGQETLCRFYRILGEQVSGVASEFALVPEKNCFPKPSSLNFVEAAAVPLVFTTAWEMAVHKAKLGLNEWVLIHAAGSGVSSALLQIAKLFQAKVIVTSSSEKKLALAKQLGADFGIHYEQTDFVEEVRKITQKRGVDVVFDHIGVTTWSPNIKVLANGGRIVICGATSGFEAVTDLRHVFFRQLKLMGSTMGSKGDFPGLLALFEKKVLRPVLHRQFSFDEVRSAYHELEQRSVFGKVVLTPTHVT